jgi:hypothetical protein
VGRGQLLGRRTAIKLLSFPSFFVSPCIQRMVSAGNITAISGNATEAAAQLAAVDVFFTDAYQSPAGTNYAAVAASFDGGTLRVRPSTHTHTRTRAHTSQRER